MLLHPAGPSFAAHVLSEPLFGSLCALSHVYTRHCRIATCAAGRGRIGQFNHVNPIASRTNRPYHATAVVRPGTAEISICRPRPALSHTVAKVRM